MSVWSSYIVRLYLDQIAQRSRATTIATAQRAVQVAHCGDPDGARRTRVVGPLDGISYEVAPADFSETGQALWSAWREHSDYAAPDMVLGVAAGGIAPALALAGGLPYRLAWKGDLDRPDKRSFVEPHGRRERICVCGDLTDRRILIVDNEISTGHTVAEFVYALRSNDVDVVGSVCLAEAAGGAGRSLLASVGVPLCALTVL